MTTVEQPAARPVTSRPAAAPVAALVVVLVNGALSLLLWSVAREGFVGAMAGATLLFAVLGSLLALNRATVWTGAGLVVGSLAVAAADVVALVLAW